jgi:inosine-uridine nucleoside N-ribohydrolase
MKFPEPGIYLHDPLTVALLASPELCPTEATRLAISDDGRVDRGAGAPNARIATDVDTKRTRLLILDTILGRTTT